MSEWWAGLSSVQQVLYCVAIPSAVLLVIQTILTFVGFGETDGATAGGGMDGDAVGTDFGGVDYDPGTADVSGGIDVDGDGNLDVFGDSSAPDIGAQHQSGLRWFTFRGIVALLCVGSWVGIALLDGGVAPALSVPIGALCGVLAMFAVALIMKAALKLQQSGNINLQNAVGATGEVYLTIPKNGKGKASVVVQERLLELDAVTTGRTLKNGERIKVVRVVQGDLLVVEPLEFDRKK